MSEARNHFWLPVLFLIAAVSLLFAYAPLDGGFSWSDSPRHALNGIFVKDLVRDMPFADPSGYAFDYYAQYPALTILFYPPLFYVTSAPLYGIFGDSFQTAIFAIYLHYIAFAIGSFKLARFWLPPLGATAVALMLVAAPEVAFWGRQIMLEIPAYAWLIWGCVFFMSYLRTDRIWTLYFAVALIVLAIYTKISIGFILLVFLAALFNKRGLALLRDKHSYIILGLAVIGLVPLMILTLKFGQANVQSVSGIADSHTSRLSLQGWIWYAKQLPGQLGWPLLLMAIAYPVWAIIRRNTILNGTSLIFLAGWFLVGYLFYSAIDLKEARHSVFILFPLVLAAGLLLEQVSQHPLRHLATLAVALFTLGYTVMERPVNFVKGYRTAALKVSELAPENANLLFSGYRDGNFIFNIRTLPDRPDLKVTRADKLLLEVAVRRGLGVKQASYGEDEIAQLINDQGIEFVVAEPDFWTDLDQMAKLQNILQSDRFREIERFQLDVNYPNSHARELVIYQNLMDFAKEGKEQDIYLPIIEMKIEAEEGSTEPSNN